jgi:3-oxoadipate enol-lactonase/4-carboxymuconolactone decarboxylase
MTTRLARRVDGVAGAAPLVLLNSLGTTTDMWTPVLGPLLEQFQVIQIDIRGHGGSPVDAQAGPVALADLGRDVLATLDDLGLDRVHIAGLSVGGMTAMWLAAHHPERVRRIAVLCSSAHLPPAAGWTERAAAVRAGGIEAVADASVGRWITADLAAHDPALVARLRAMIGDVSAEGYAQACEAIASMDLRADLARIAAPTLVVAAAQDPATPPLHGEVIATGILGARLRLLDHAAHLATVEQPGVIAQELSAHFGAAGAVAAGFATRRAVLGDAHVDRAIAATTEFDEPFQRYITANVWGGIWTRPGLSRRDRSIVTLAALATLGSEHEIAMHVRAAVRNGVRAEEISEVLLHVAAYAGAPRANRAIAIAREALSGWDPAEDT